MGINRIHQIEDLRFIDGDIQVLHHLATLYGLPKPINCRLNRLIVNIITFGREDHDNAVLSGKLLIHFLVFLTFIAGGQESGDILLVAHPRSEEGKESGQHHSQSDRQPAPPLQKVIYTQEKLRHLYKKRRKNIKISAADVRC